MQNVDLIKLADQVQLLSLENLLLVSKIQEKNAESLV